MTIPRLICWFSCGAASAVATKLAIAQYSLVYDIVIARCIVKEEHPDNDRFANDCELWFGHPITNMIAEEYNGSVWNVMQRRKYISGVDGAPCTMLLKKKVREDFQRPNDKHIFGYCAEEQGRYDDFLDANNIDCEAPLIDRNLSHANALAMIENAGIKLPVMYGLGYQHNNCFSGDTEFITDKGVKTLAEMVGKTVKVRGTGGGWTDGEIKAFGTQPLLALTLRRNGIERVIHTTSGHRWFVKQYVHSAKVEKVTSDLQPGDKLRSIFGGLGKMMRPSAFGIAQGIVFGDGTRGRTLNTAATLVLCGEKNKELLQYFPLSPSAEIPTGIEVRDLPRHWKDVPEIEECQSFLYGWLAGYFAADGCVNDGEYLLSSANINHLKFARDVAVRLGIGANAIRTIKRVGLGQAATELHTLPLIGATLREDFFLISAHKERFNAKASREAHPWTVVSVQGTSRVEEVYCAVVPDGQAFALEGNILTGNCIGCVKSSGAGYWNKIRQDFPVQFWMMAGASRVLGVKMIQITESKVKKRIFLDELEPGTGRYQDEPEIQCGIFCEAAQREFET